MKSYNVEIIEQRKITLNIEARNQPEAIRLGYDFQDKQPEFSSPKVVKIKAKQRFV